MHIETENLGRFRPRILLRAAKIRLRQYDREMELTKILSCRDVPKPGCAISQLSEIETGLETARKNGDAAYRPHRHILVLSAFLNELSLCRA